MKYLESVTDFFKAREWWKSLGLAAVCMLIPVVGPMVVLGWLLAGFWGRADDRPETFPTFDFAKFGDYLTKGLWPVLVSLVASIPAGLVMMVPAVMFAISMAATAAAGEQGSVGLGGVFAMLVSLLAGAVALVFIAVVVKPLALRAALVQDFAKAFNFAFVKRFVGLVWLEMLLSFLVPFGVMVAAYVLAAMVICFGFLVFLAAMPLVHYAWVHLDKQLYQLYLARGGEPVEISSKLAEPAGGLPPAQPL